MPPRANEFSVKAGRYSDWDDPPTIEVNGLSSSRQADTETRMEGSLMSFPTDPHLANLQQQRKRAKDLRRAHHEGQIEAAVRIARYLPRARSQSPEQVLRSEFRLSEAQFVVAREAGFSKIGRAHV